MKLDQLLNIIDQITTGKVRIEDIEITIKPKNNILTNNTQENNSQEREFYQKPLPKTPEDNTNPRSNKKTMPIDTKSYNKPLPPIRTEKNLVIDNKNKSITGLTKEEIKELWKYMAELEETYGNNDSE